MVQRYQERGRKFFEAVTRQENQREEGEWKEKECGTCGNKFSYWHKRSWMNWAPKDCSSCYKANQWLGIFKSRID